MDVKDDLNAYDIDFDPERVITVRLRKSLYDILVKEAKENELSLNKWCIKKLRRENE